MVQYGLYAGAVGTAVVLTCTGKGKIVGMNIQMGATGGAGVGTMGLSITKNFVPSSATSFTVNNPQKELVIANCIMALGNAVATDAQTPISGLDIEYQAGDTLNAVTIAHGGTAPASGYALIQFYCVEK